jgi:hypothetical protein
MRLDQAAFLMVAIFALAACGGSADTDGLPSGGTTDEPLVEIQPSPTATEPPAMPKPGGIFSGSLSIRTFGDNATAGGGELELNISADGTTIATLGFSMRNTRCTNDAGSITIESGGWSSEITPGQPIPIINGRFEFNVGALTASGEFTSSTEATATVEIESRENVAPGSFITCDFGSWDWTGTTQ